MIPAPSEGAQVQLPRHPIYISHTPSFGLDRSPALSGTPDRTQQHEATSTPPLTRHFAPPQAASPARMRRSNRGLGSGLAGGGGA